jgi:hypothetical protein
MATIFVFGNEVHAPLGGMDDLLAIIDNSQGDKVDEYGHLHKDILEKVLQTPPVAGNTYLEQIQILSVNADGTVAGSQCWREAPPPIGIAPGAEAPIPAEYVRGVQTNYRLDPYQSAISPLIIR